MHAFTFIYIYIDLVKISLLRGLFSLILQYQLKFKNKISIAIMMMLYTKAIIYLL